MPLNNKTSCWSCKYFIQTSTSGPNGVCVRHAPTKQDQLIGEASTNVYPFLAMFQSLIDATATTCGEYALMEGEVPPEL